MIQIKHFVAERDGKDKPPSWTAAEEWMKSLTPAMGMHPVIVHAKAYPSPTHHNLILIVDDNKTG